ncbi:chemotaxis response regulator protein-glutamate methylesterase [bacterium]|nr:chemotaxis response regulator protein-glutamate methylesterase [bacterium]
MGVLVVDDSAFMRKVITEIIEETDEFFVVDTARDGQDALEKLARLGEAIQLVTLDINMPRMDGMTCLRRIMERHPKRVVMVSSLTTEGAEETLAALEYGAVDFLAKPGGAISHDFKSVGQRLVEILRSAALSQLPLRRDGAVDAVSIRRSPSAGRHAAATGSRRLVVIASSTGGPKALAGFIPSLPKDLGAAMIVVQHMPSTFTRLLAERLDKSSKVKVKEAKDGDQLLEGLCLLAPGGQHMEVTRGERVRLTREPPIKGLRPCADITFKTVASIFGGRAAAVVLTGMGHDGTEGCRAMKSRGSRILVESEDSALIYGMPKSIVENGLHDRKVPIGQMAQAVVDTIEAT